MYRVTDDEEVFKKFWANDASVRASHFQVSTKAKNTSEEDFLDFCARCDRVYLINDVALLYIERIGANANIHFSLLKGHKVTVEDLLPIRDELLEDFEMVFGWCGVKNRGLKRLLEGCGLRYLGFAMLEGWHHGRAFEFHCFSLSKG